MEGAGFMYACLIHGLPFAQVRAVSNIVETRNRRGLEDGRSDRGPRAGVAADPRTRYEADARLLALPERLLHVRRDRQPAHRPRRARVRRPPGGRRGAQQGGVRRRGGRHQAELPRVRLLRRPLRAARRRAARSAATAVRCSSRSGTISREEVAGGSHAGLPFPASTRPRTSCSVSRFPDARQTNGAACSRRSSPRC